MNDDQLNHLFAAARRAGPPDTGRVAVAFDTRLLARLRAEREQPAALWTVWLWRLVPVAAAFVIALGVWEWVTPAAELTPDNEQALLVALLAGEE